MTNYVLRLAAVVAFTILAGATLAAIIVLVPIPFSDTILNHVLLATFILVGLVSGGILGYRSVAAEADDRTLQCLVGMVLGTVFGGLAGMIWPVMIVAAAYLAILIRWILPWVRLADPNRKVT